MPVMRQHQQSHTPQEQETAEIESQETPQAQQQQSSQGSIPPVAAASSPQPQMQSASDRAFGADFSQVRAHEGGGNAALGAHAYATGNELHLGDGAGAATVAHEATHTVQQGAEEAEQEEEEKQRG